MEQGLLFLGTKHLLGVQMFLFHVCVTVRRKHSLTSFGTLSLRHLAPLYFLPVMKTVQIIHLIKLLWDPFTWMKSSKQIRRFEMAAIWFHFHNRDCKVCPRSQSSLCYILHVRLPAMRFPLCVWYWMFYYLSTDGRKRWRKGSLETWCKSPSYSLLRLAAVPPCQKTGICIYRGFSI